MRLPISIVLTSVVLLGAPAHAAVQTFDFTARIDFLGDPNNYTYPSVAEGMSSGTAISLGDVITGRFTYDNESPFVSAWPESAPDSGAQGSFGYRSPKNTLEFTIAPSGQHFQSVFHYVNLNVENNSWNVLGRDGIWLNHTGPLDANGWSSAQDASVFFSDSTGTTLSSGVLPATLNPGDYEINRLNFTWRRASDGYNMMGGARFESVTQVSPVPEPSSISLMVASLACLGVLARRRARRR